MKRILICADDVAVESLLVVLTKHMGHEPEVLGSAPSDAIPEGHLFLVDPTASRATAWAEALRRRDAGTPVVAIGLDPFDPDSLGFTPTEVIGKPFGFDELSDSIARSLRRS